MTLNVIHADPPNREAIEARFGVLPGSVIFTYGPNVYVPSGEPLTKALEAHEGVHVLQQGGDPEGWWNVYLSDDDFRLDQELAAHRAEWRVLSGSITDRNARVEGLRSVARRLASPMYGGLVTVSEAMRLIGSHGE